MNDTRIKELSDKIKEARSAYYGLDPIISDQEYDALMDELKKLDPNNQEVLAVGAPVQYTVWEKVKHIIPMGSLDKVKNIDEFNTWINTWFEDTKIHTPKLLITHKIDGSSLEVVYKDGKLVMAASRGDGVIGENITTNAIQIPDLPKSINAQGDVVVRGEVVMLKEVFQKLYAAQYANPRNTAAGKIRDKKNKGVDCANLTFIAYTIMHENAPNTEFARFELLSKLGFQVPDYMAVDMSYAAQAHDKIKNNREKIPYEIDGTVIRINNIEMQEGLGDLNMRPRGQIAWKFDPSMGVSKVIDIRWQVGTNGRITPVAKIEPIDVGGVTITSVSLHNLAMFKELNLTKGCEVLVSRRNDVIPYIESNLSLK